MDQVHLIVSQNIKFIRRHTRRLLKDFPFLLKVYELIMAAICMRELVKYTEYAIPRWLWIIYCIDASTYFIIFFSIALTHVFEKPRRLPEFAYFTVGVVFHLIGAIAGIVRSQYEETAEVLEGGEEEKEEPRSELKIGLLILANLLVLSVEAGYMALVDYYGMKPPIPHSTISF